MSRYMVIESNCCKNEYAVKKIGEKLGEGFEVTFHGMSDSLILAQDYLYYLERKCVDDSICRLCNNAPCHHLK